MPTPEPVVSQPRDAAAPQPRPAESSHVVVVGGANMDIGARSHLVLASADSTPGEVLCSAGGVARNVAENLARLAGPGERVSFLSVVGDDVFGQRLLQITGAAGVDVTAVGVLPGERTASYLSVHTRDGELAIAVNDMAILARLAPAFLQSHVSLVKSAHALVLDCNLSSEALYWLLHTAASAQTHVFVDAVSVAKCRKVQSLMASIGTLKVNQLEAHALSGQSVHSPADGCLAALRLHQMGVSNVVVSLGGQGVSWCDAQGRTGHRAAGKVDVINTSGAGDALLAGLVHAYVPQWDLRNAIEFAMACAELTLASPFANAPSLCVAAVSAHLNAQNVAPTPINLHESTRFSRYRA